MTLINNQLLRHSHRAFKSLKQTAFRIHTHGQLYSHAAATLKIPNVDTLQPNVRKYVQEKMSLCQPDNIHICDGSEAENDMLLSLLEKEGMIKKLKKHENCPTSAVEDDSTTVAGGPVTQSTFLICSQLVGSYRPKRCGQGGEENHHFNTV